MLIAICDDSREYINVVEEYFDTLKTLSFEYDIFESGEELVKIYQSNLASYDAILLDMQMKNLDGIETANLIRKMDKQVIIIFVTSHTQYMQKSFECSPFRFLVKPIDVKDLQKLLIEIQRKLKDETQTIVFTENGLDYFARILYYLRVSCIVSGFIRKKINIKYINLFQSYIHS